jgi:transposase
MPNKRGFSMGSESNLRLLALYAAGQSYKDMAATLGLTFSVVRSRVYEARKAGLLGERRQRESVPVDPAQVYDLYYQGLGFDEIAMRLGVAHQMVKVTVGTALRKGIIAKRKAPPKKPEVSSGLQRMEAQLMSQLRTEFLTKQRATDYMSSQESYYE